MALFLTDMQSALIIGNYYHIRNNYPQSKLLLSTYPVTECHRRGQAGGARVGVRGRIMKVAIECSPSAPTSLLLTLRMLCWTMLTEWVSSTKMMSTELAALESGSHYRARQTPSLDPPRTQSNPCLGIQYCLSSGVASFMWVSG